MMTTAGHDHDEDPQPNQKMGMDREQRLEMLALHHERTQWVYWTLIFLGAWVVLSPLTFSYAAEPVVPSGGRGVWLGLENRALAMKISDLVSGALLIVYGWRSLRPNRPISLWICCGVGVWLSMAPVLFWAPTAAAYLNDTLVGMLVIALTILIPGMPNMIMYMKMGSSTPPGWSYNPSSWAQRSILIALGFAGFVVSRYLAAFQLGYIDTIWEPFFGDGSRQVLNSNMSQMWPISDAAFGTLAYTFEFLMGFMGSQSRWRTMPWMVALYGMLVIPLGMVHILLVISQPVVVGAWCTFCLLAAVLMLPMIPLEGDEVVAMLQHMRGTRHRGQRAWDVFWKGGSPEGSQPDERSPGVPELVERPGAILRASVWGFSVPWTLVIASGLGIACMATPSLARATGAAAASFQLAGALVVAFSVIAMGEVFRVGRFVNLPLALVLGLAPFVVGEASLAAKVWGLLAAAAIVALSLPTGPVRERYATWDPWIR